MINEKQFKDWELEKALIVAEYQSLRDEIQSRLSRVFKLQQALLLGTLIYFTTFYLPKIINYTTNSPVAILFYLFILILPIIAFVVEQSCLSEEAAILRAGVYIRDNVEQKYRTSIFRGWEEWLERLDTKKRRRKSEELIKETRRKIIIPLYCFVSSIIGGVGLSYQFNIAVSPNSSTFLYC